MGVSAAVPHPWSCSQIDLSRNSITLWNEQPVLEVRMGFRLRAIHWNVPYLWILSGVCYSRQAVPITVICSFAPHLHCSFSILTVTLFPLHLLQTPQNRNLSSSFVCGGETPLLAAITAGDVILREHHKILTETSECRSLQAFSKHSFFLSFSHRRARNWIYHQLRSLKWCQCSHGNYSYISPCTSHSLSSTQVLFF